MYKIPSGFRQVPGSMLEQGDPWLTVITCTRQSHKLKILVGFWSESVSESDFLIYKFLHDTHLWYMKNLANPIISAT